MEKFLWTISGRFFIEIFEIAFVRIPVKTLWGFSGQIASLSKTSMEFLEEFYRDLLLFWVKS